MGHPGLHLHAQAAQVIGNQLGGSGFPVAQFRVLVNVPPPRDDFGLDLTGSAVDLGSQRSSLCSGGHRLNREQQADG
jgi:hypothetical protein